MHAAVPLLAPLALLAAGPQAAPPPPVAEDAATVALKEYEERMTVPVQIAGAGPYRFVIDTGAERTVISRELAGKLGLPSGPTVNVTAMSGTSPTGTVVIPSLSVSAFPEQRAIQAPLFSQVHLGGQGLLGIDTLRNHRVTIDFDTQTMAVAPSERRAKPLRAQPGEIVVRAKSLLGQLIVTDAEFEGRPIRVVIDTGSAVSIGNSAMRRLVARATGRVKPLELTSVTGATIATDYAIVDRVRVGSIAFGGLPIAFADVPPFKRFGLDRRPAMLLGMSALKSFRHIDVDFPNREVRFRKPRVKSAGERCLIVANQRCAA